MHITLETWGCFMHNTLMERNATIYLKSWFKDKKRKPLILRGARQVGKSTLVRLFAEELDITLVEINFETLKLKSLNEEINIEDIIEELEYKFQVNINRKTLLFFDEIQQAPLMIQALRYFYEKKPEIPIIAAGSLLEFALENKSFSMPVGRIEYYHLGPMSFFEFLNAIGAAKLLNFLIENPFKLKEYHYVELTNYFKKYLYIGGMPEAILTYINTKDMNKVQKVHQSIVQTYRTDFSKYSTRSQQFKMEELFDVLPRIIGKKFKYTEISTIYQAREIKVLISLLEKSKVIQKCYHTNGISLPLKAYADTSVYKIFFLDVGILNYLNGSSYEEIQDYNEQTFGTKGVIAEQFTAQHLSYLHGGHEPPELFYWLRDKKNENAEVDFVIKYKNKICPLEVKSGKAGKMKSLFQFAQKNNCKLGIRVDLKDRSNEKSDIEVVEHLIDSEKVKIDLLNFHIGQIELLR